MNVHAVAAIYRFEMARTWRTLTQSIVSPVLSTALYFVARKAGRGLLFRYGRFLHVTPERLEQAERWVNRHGALAVCPAPQDEKSAPGAAGRV